MEMPVQMMQASRSQGQKGRVTDKGTETIKVPAGSFTTQHMQYQDGETVGDTWVNKEVSPYGIVRSQAKDFENGARWVWYGSPDADHRNTPEVRDASDAPNASAPNETKMTGKGQASFSLDAFVLK